MAETILQLWDGLIGDQNKKPTERNIYKMSRQRNTQYGYFSRSKLVKTGTVIDLPGVKNEKFINTKQISNWEDFTKRSIAPDRKNPATELNSTWAPTAKPYFGEGGS